MEFLLPALNHFRFLGNVKNKLEIWQQLPLLSYNLKLYTL